MGRIKASLRELDVYVVKHVEGLDKSIDGNIEDLNEAKEIIHDVNEAIGILEDIMMEHEARIGILEDQAWQKGFNMVENTVNKAIRDASSEVLVNLRKEMNKRLVQLEEIRNQSKDQTSKSI